MKSPFGLVFRHIIRNFAASEETFARNRAIIHSMIDKAVSFHPKVSQGLSRVALKSCESLLVTPPQCETNRIILFCHGGAFCFSMINLYLPFIHDLATETRMRILMPDYRLAPEHPHPAALEDCMGAINWIKQESDIDGNPIIVGDSAGGNLALNLSQALGGCRGLGLLSPWLDLSQSSNVWNQECDDELVLPEAARRAAWLYINGNSDWSFGAENPDKRDRYDRKVFDPSVSPLFGSLSFLERTPLLVQVSGSERLFGDAKFLWERISGNVPIPANPNSMEKLSMRHENSTLSVYPNQPHVWQVVRRRSRASQLAFSELVNFINDRA